MAVEADQVREQVKLGTRAVYRVVEVRDDITRVEVLEAPGLPAGHLLDLTTRAVSGMQVVERRARGAASSERFFRADPTQWGQHD